MKKNLRPISSMEIFMNVELIEDLVEMTKKVECSSLDSYLTRMAVVIEREIADLEEKGKPVTRDSLHTAIKNLIEKHKKMDAA